MPKEIPIEKFLNPDIDELVKVDDTYQVTISDAELDEFVCTFNFDDCVTIDTSGMEYIVLTRHNLNLLKKYLDKTEKIYLKEHNENRN